MVGTFGCSARAATGHATAAPPLAKPATPGITERARSADKTVFMDGPLESKSGCCRDRLPPSTDLPGRSEHSLHGAMLRSRTCWIPWAFLVRVGSRWHLDLSQPRSHKRVLKKFRNVSEPGSG